MRPSPCLLVIIPALTLVACSSGGNHYAEEAASSKRNPVEVADSTTFRNDITALNSASRKRVRTADVRCRVNNVFKATTALEHAVIGMEGVIVESTLQNDFGRSEDIPYTADSLKRINLYTPTANLTLRVPAASLDSVVSTLTSMASFIDSRILKSEDKTLDYLSNSLKNKDATNDSAPVTPGTKYTQLDVVAYKDREKENVIDRKIVNMSILDDVNYATFSVQLFQPQMADVQIVVNPDRVIHADFGTELLNSLRNGTDIFKNVFLFFLQLWPFLLLGAAAWFGYKKIAAKKVSA
jgi:hypothetical protein